MDKTTIKLGIGVSIPLTIVACYACEKIGVIVGRYEAYKEMAIKKNENSED